MRVNVRLLPTWGLVSAVCHSVVSAAALRSTPPLDVRPVFLPQGVYVGQETSLNTSAYGDVIVLSISSPIATLDYRNEVAGIPVFTVSSLGKPVQIEIKYSEAYHYLDLPLADGPYSFAVSLANAHRVETFNITSTGSFASPLVQGGQRWQSIRLLSEGSIAFDRVGFEATVDLYDPNKLPAHFQSDRELLNKVWSLGATAAATGCVEKGTQPAIWEIDPVKGVLLRSMKPAAWAHGMALANYTLEFDAMIERGGVWWMMAYPSGGYGPYLQLKLVGELPEDSTFINVNKTLSPPNSIMVSYGYDFVNQTTLTSWYIDTFPVPAQVSENTWHRVKSVMSPSGHLSVSLNGQQVFNVSMSDYYTGGAPVSFRGSFGVGAWQDDMAYVRNLKVTETSSGAPLYANSLTSDDVLAEFGTGSNTASVCLDGPKRDRLVWLGDFYHTSRVVGSSTSRFDMMKGTIDFMLGTQNDDGLLSIETPMGYDPAPRADAGPAGGLEDYQLLGASSMYGYIRHSNDLDFLRATWPRWERQLAWVMSRINETNGLLHLTSEFLATGATAPTSSAACAAVQVFREFAEMAEALGKSDAASLYSSVADSLASSSQKRLWNRDLGVFSTAIGDGGNFTVAGLAFCITSGVATSEQAERSIAALEKLRLGIGYKDSTAVDPKDPDTKLSPNTNGFLLDALFKAGAYTAGHELIKTLWGAMVTNPATSSGASWEYATPDGQPGLAAFTSLAHPWGGAPTYVLTEWAAGLQTAPGPAGFGYRSWVVKPEAGLRMGLEQAKARVQGVDGLVAVEWSLAGTDVRVVIQAPSTTSGTFVLGEVTTALKGNERYELTVPWQGDTEA